MDQPSTVRNPFMLLLHPEEVLAAVEKSEPLGQLNRHLCRPLDRPSLPQADGSVAADSELSELGELSGLSPLDE